jgi:glc operon protein GlcG
MRIASAAAIIGIIAAPVAYAQTPATPPPVPEVMPFDVPYGQPIGLDLANKAISAAAAEAKKHNWKMSISVVAPAGYLVAHATMDGTQYASVEISQSKARTAALFRRQTSVFQTGVNTGGMTAALSLMAITGGVASEGGFPIVVDGNLIGAIGASGGVSTQDAATAKAGLDAITVK